MVRFFGFRNGGNNKQQNKNNNNDDDDNDENNKKNHKPANKRHRKRLLATARTPELLRERHAMFRYAVNEFAQTVQAGTSNDDGQLMQRLDDPDFDPEQQQQQQQEQQDDAIMLPSSRRQLYSPPPQQQQSQQASDLEEQDQQQVQHQQLPLHLQPLSSSSTTTTTLDSQQQQQQLHRDTLTSFDSMNVEPARSRTLQQQFDSSSTPYLSADSLRQQQQNRQPPISHRQRRQLKEQEHYAIRSPFEDELPIFGYEESYGDAYTDAPIKYIYPLGYQSMRPRSAPWRLSVIICLCFTWLSVFIVGHCSDQANEYYNSGSGGYSGGGGYAGYSQLFYYNRDKNNNANDGSSSTTTDTNDNNNIDDDSLVIEIRWCGSRPLYLMWVASMLITGLAASYCSVIGYIKCRDFAVANSRSQPPWAAAAGAAGSLAGGYIPTKSDYYVSLQNSHLSNSHYSHHFGSSTYQGGTGGGGAGSVVSGSDYSNQNQNNNTGRQRNHSHQPTIYQADGTPQFWGSHIYRPTQAAVAVTSR